MMEKKTEYNNPSEATLTAPGQLVAGGSSEATDTVFNDRIEKNALPAFLHNQVQHRVSTICLFGLSFFAVPIIFDLFSHVKMGPERFIFFINGLNSILFYFLVNQKGLSTNYLINVSLVYEVVTSYIFSCIQTVDKYTGDYTPRQILAWTAAWIIVFPLVVPCSPRKTFIAATCSVLTVLLAIQTGDYFFESNPSPHLYRDTLVIYSIVIVFACFCSDLVYKLNWQVAKERQKSSYELLDLLGEGNMGSVWHVRHRMLHRPAAMKVISAKYLNNKDQEKESMLHLRFEREAQATASLCSPNSIILYDFGLMDDGSFFYVMELLEGQDMQFLTKNFGTISAERTVYFLLQICDSLSDAHAKGLIHRDIKPANIMVCKYGVKYDFIKVLDFGMVKQQKQELENLDEISDTDNKPSFTDNEDTTLTQPGAISGTPAFMAPEMAQKKHVDGRYDIYSLGCVAYWLLVGELLFPGKSMMGTLVAHLRTKPTPPSEKMDAPIPQELDRIILWCLEKDPDKRPQTAEELAKSLRQIKFEDPWDQDKAKSWWEENRNR